MGTPHTPGSGRVRLGAALVIASVIAPCRRASADDKQGCVTSYEQAQALQKSGKLKAAREQLVQCAQASCPTVIREDCARALPDVEASLPTVVVEAFDLAGAQTAAVRVLVDGATLGDRLDGRAVAVDPGQHTFRYELEGAEPVEQRLLVLEGDKRRRLQVRFTRAAGAPPPSAAGPPDAPPDADAGAGRPYGVAPWVVGGVGVAAVAAGAVLIAVGSSRVSDAEDQCPERSCTDQDAIDRGNSGRTVVQTGLIVLVAGGAVTLGGLVWQLAWNAPQSTARARIAPVLAPGFAGLAAGGRF